MGPGLVGIVEGTSVGSEEVGAVVGSDQLGAPAGLEVGSEEVGVPVGATVGSEVGPGVGENVSSISVGIVVLGDMDGAW